MTADAEEPTGAFVPEWDDEDREAAESPVEAVTAAPPARRPVTVTPKLFDDDTAETIRRPDVDELLQPARVAEHARPAEDDLSEDDVDEHEDEDVAAAAFAAVGADREDPRSMGPVANLRAVAGLLLVVVTSGIALAAAIALVLAAVAFALRRAAGG